MVVLLGLPVAAGAQESGAEVNDHIPAPLCERVRSVETAALGSPLDGLRRVAAIDGCVPPDPRSMRRAGPPPAPLEEARFRARLLPATVYAIERSAYPDDRNNGALWSGVGLSTAFRAGVQLQAPFVIAVLQPELLYQENGDFDRLLRHRTGFSPYISPFYTTIDLPQRFGERGWWDLVPGDSYVRVDVGPVAAGASTESLWRGPAHRYPILMSNTAGGFPHLFVGTSRGVDVRIARVGGELVWGRLTESDYFDEIPDNDETGIVNVTLTVEPRWPGGLSLGVTRSYLYRPDGDDLDRVLETLGWAGGVNRDGNELASAFARWVFEEAGAEVYGEFARDDVLGPLHHFLMEPDHSQAYMAGFQKLTSLTEDWALRVQGELVALQEKGELRTDSRPMPIYYTHSQIRQGYTHRGQLLGAGIGPGADAQFLAIDGLWSRGTVGAYFERVRRNDQTGAALDARRWFPYEHDTEVTGGVRALYFYDAFAFWADVARSFRYNRDFGDDDTNWRLEVRLTWSPELEWSR